MQFQVGQEKLGVKPTAVEVIQRKLATIRFRIFYLPAHKESKITVQKTTILLHHVGVKLGLSFYGGNRGQHTE
jgi:hypothetical protein